MLKLNAHAIEFIKSSSKDAARQELARDFLLKAETALLQTPSSSQVANSGGLKQTTKNKLLAITQNNLGQLFKM